MKKHLLALLFSSVIVLSNCGSDDEEEGPYDGIPSGEIVVEDQRHITLTGIAQSGSGRSLAVGQKWWKGTERGVKYNGTCNDQLPVSQYQDNEYIAFNPGGSLFTKEGANGDELPAGNWQWEDNKDAIQINRPTFAGKYVLRALDDTQVVYMKEVVDGECTIITWERLTDPITEQ